MTGEPIPFQRGDYARLSCDGYEPVCFIALAAQGGASLIVMFDGMIDGCVGAMPLLWRDGGYVNVMTGRPVALTPHARADA